MLNYIKGDLFSHRAELPVILAHACNPFGSWGGGIAAQFRKRYPYALKLYTEHCEKHGTDLLGSCLIVPTSEHSPSIYVACLFTSDFKNSQDSILQYTQKSMDDLAQQLKDLSPVEENSSGKPVVNMPMINSGIFNVPWEATEQILKSQSSVSINVYTL